MSERIMSKKEKFRTIASRVFDIMTIQNYFYSTWRAVSSDFNEEEKETYNTLWRVYMDGLTPRHENNPQYDEYLSMISKFTKEVIAKYVPKPWKYASGYDFNLDFLEEVIVFKEVENWKLGSKFTCVLNEHVQVKRIPLITDEDGYWKNHLYGCLRSYDIIKDYDVPINFAPEVALMEEGLYEIVPTGERFDIRDNSRSKEIEFDYEQRDTHSIAEFKLPEADKIQSDLEWYEEYEEETCCRCGGGGCPKCDTTGFFTGIKVY